MEYRLHSLNLFLDYLHARDAECEFRVEDVNDTKQDRNNLILAVLLKKLMSVLQMINLIAIDN